MLVIDATDSELHGTLSVRSLGRVALVIERAARQRSNKPEDDLRARSANENPGMVYEDHKNWLGNLTLLEKPINIVAGNAFTQPSKMSIAKAATT
ncbi:hypothetical protein [Comamonas thiooxydans]|uniref:hypothetical protein n=1 Tax=Comamonas thiooxydans TaxID=363952 RepID=UPI001E59EAA3|nr:hypothetical protein [Comamonas thiooxydans]